MSEKTILLADAEATRRVNLTEVLRREGFNAITCRDDADALEVLKRQEIHAVIADLRRPGRTGMDLLDHMGTLAPEAVVMVIAAPGELETAAQNAKRGVQEFVCIPLVVDDVVCRLKRLLTLSDLRRENHLLKQQLRLANDALPLVGETPEFQDIQRTVTRLADTMSSVLICGERGTGKERIARAIHRSGATAEKPFVVLNCSDLTESVVAQELFGVCRRGCDGAEMDKEGSFETANGGTLFLDEITALEPPSQAALLHAIEQRAVVRLGECKPRRVDVRVIAATTFDLAAAVRRGEFRDDLYHRLNIIRIVIPPLRERRDDIRALTDHFVRTFNRQWNMQCPGLTNEAHLELLQHPWRANVRELRNVIERAMIHANDKRIDVDDLALSTPQSARCQPFTSDLRQAVHAFEREHIRKVIALVQGNKVEAAHRLGIGLSSLYRKLDDLDVSRDAQPSAPTENSHNQHNHC